MEHTEQQKMQPAAQERVQQSASQEQTITVQILQVAELLVEKQQVHLDLDADSNKNHNSNKEHLNNHEMDEHAAQNNSFAFDNFSQSKDYFNILDSMLLTQNQNDGYNQAQVYQPLPDVISQSSSQSQLLTQYQVQVSSCFNPFQFTTTKDNQVFKSSENQSSQIQLHQNQIQLHQSQIQLHQNQIQLHQNQIQLDQHNQEESLQTSLQNNGTEVQKMKLESQKEQILVNEIENEDEGNKIQEGQLKKEVKQNESDDENEKMRLLVKKESEEWLANTTKDILFAYEKWKETKDDEEKKQAGQQLREELRKYFRLEYINPNCIQPIAEPLLTDGRIAIVFLHFLGPKKDNTLPHLIRFFQNKLTHHQPQYHAFLDNFHPQHQSKNNLPSSALSNASNVSNKAENGSSSNQNHQVFEQQKTSFFVPQRIEEKMDIVGNEEQVIKRSSQQIRASQSQIKILNKQSSNIENVVQPGKKTKQKKYTKTTNRKAKVSFLNSSNQKDQSQNQRNQNISNKPTKNTRVIRAESINSKEKVTQQKQHNTKTPIKSLSASKSNKSNKKQHNLDERDHNLGSKFTLKEIAQKKTNQLQLYQVRVSARIASKSKKVELIEEGQSLKKNGRSSKSSNKRRSQTEHQQNQRLINQLEQISSVEEMLKKITPNRKIILCNNFEPLNQSIDRITQILFAFNQIQLHDSENQEEIGQDNDETNFQDENSRQRQSKLVIRNLVQRSHVEPTSQEEAEERRQEFEKNKEKYKIELPTTVRRVVNPNINGHNIYALIELGRITEMELGTRFAITPLTNLEMARKSYIEQDLATAKRLAVGYEDNLAFIRLTTELKAIIDDQNRISFE